VASAIGWNSFSNTPDYNNACSSYTNCSVPSNLAGYQYPHTGNAYCGVYTYDKAGFYREAIGGQLSAPLTVGQKYYVSFFTSLTIKGPNNAYASNNIGAKFSTVAYNTTSVSNQIPINNIAQLKSYSIITDTSNWIQIMGSFIADSAYQYVALGNFFDDANTDTIRLGGGALPIEAYYFIDDVCVSTDSLYTATWTSVIENENEGGFVTVFPNPTSTGIFTLTSANNTQIENAELFDVIGKQMLLKRKRADENRLEINISELPEGLYFIRVKTESGTLTKKVLLTK
jgi:hypothetical protein